MSQPTPSRRALLTGGAALAAAGYVADPALAATSITDAALARGKKRVRLTVLGTTDLHGNVFNWDYYKDKEFDNSAHDDIGVAKVATLIKGVRKDRKGEPILTLDAGDTIQGTPLAYYYAKVEPITAGAKHPMANAMNLVGYDAAALGNHEFNYGIDTLRAFESQLNFPLLGANAVDPATKRPVFPPYIIRKFKVGDGRTLKVGVLGLTNPGIAIWDKANVEGRMEFPGPGRAGQEVRPGSSSAKGCDLVIVVRPLGRRHLLVVRRRAALPGERRVPGRRAGAARRRDPGRPRAQGDRPALRPQREDRPAGADLRAVLLGHAPGRHGLRGPGGLRAVRQAEVGARGLGLAAAQLQHRGRGPDGRRCGEGAARHRRRRTSTRSIGKSTEAMSAARAVVEDVPIIDFVNFVQADAVKKDLTGDPVRRAAGAVDRRAVQPPGVVPGR